MGRIYRRPKTRNYWVAYFRNGREYRESAHSERASDARRLLKQRIGEIASRRFVEPAAARIPFEQLAGLYTDDYERRGLSSSRAAEARVKHLTEFFEACRARDITTEQICRYQTTRLAEGASPATVNRETAALGRMFKLGVRLGHLSASPLLPERLKESAPRQGFFEPHEYAAIRAQLPSDYADVLEFAYHTGWRRQEITSLTWAEVDRAAAVIRLSPARSKNGEGRILPISDVIGELLERRERLRVEGLNLVFHRRGERMVDWRKAWQNACRAAGCEGKRLHDARRTVARNLIQAGVPERVAMQLTGHKTRSVFDRYNIVIDSDLRNGVSMLAAYVTQRTQAVSGAPAGSAEPYSSRTVPGAEPAVPPAQPPVSG